MGTHNLPGASGQFGNAFVCMLKEGCLRFQRQASHKNFLCHLAGKPFDPDLGTGCLKFTSDGDPCCCRVWIHVDNILLHGATMNAVSESLDFAINLALELVLVCQPAKMSPPAQMQKFGGFLYDTQEIPVQKVPTKKVSRAFALLSCVLRDINGPLARLGLRVLVGTPQLLVPATLSIIGSNFLFFLYADLSHGMDPSLHGLKSIYYNQVHLFGSSLDKMDWWFSSLQSGLVCKSQPSDAKVSSLHFGDGSGTRTGGTRVFYDRSKPGDPKSWMGTWTFSATGKLKLEGALHLSRGALPGACCQLPLLWSQGFLFYR
jgi:hypothetical protein